LSNYEFVEIVLEYAYKQYDRVNRNVFEYIESTYWSYIINNFEKCKGYYTNHKVELDSVLRSVINREGEQPYSNVVQFLIENFSKSFKDIFEFHAIKLVNKALNLSRNIGVDNYLFVHSFYEDAYKLARRYTLGKQLREFEKLKISVEKAKDEYLTKHGSVIKHELTTKEIIDDFREKLISRKIPINIIFLGLTHVMSKAENKFEPAINSVFDFPKSVITDLVRHVGLESNQRFTPSIQMHLSHFFGYTDFLLGKIIRESDLSEHFFLTLSDVLQFVLDEYKLDCESLIDELNGIIDSIVFLFSIDKSYPFYRTFSYGLSQTICLYIEKILRKVYVEINVDDIFFKSESNLTLGNLLQDNRIKHLLGDTLTSIITFELLFFLEHEHGLERKVGMNHRNRLMHNYDIDYKQDIHIGLVLHLFHILVMIIHQLEVTLIKIE